MDQYDDASDSAMPGESAVDVPASGSGKQCTRIEVKPTVNGGFSATCYYKTVERGPKDRGPSYIEPDDYAFSTFDELAQWMRGELGAPAAPAAPPDMGAAPAAA